MGQRISVSVVFTDLVGSTELSSRVGPDGSEELRQVHFGLLRAALAKAGGTEVKNLGDGLMVAFPSAGAAVAGAVAMQQAIERRNRRAAEPLSVRIGISSGDAVGEDGDYFGEPVVEAARLCAAAQGGEILASQVVSLLVKGTGHGFEPVGALELKGLPDPVETVRVLWSRDAEEPFVPLPPRLDSALARGRHFVGRERELRLLADALDAAVAGEPQIVFVAGEPGVGKTALIAEFARSARAEGTVVVYGRSDEELAVPYQPWVEAVGLLVEHGPEALLQQHVDQHGPHLARLVPTLSGRVGGDAPRATDPETERYLMFQSVCTLFEAASDAPLVVVLDDLHWVDAPSLALLRHVVATPMARPPLIIGTYRDTDVVGTHPLVDTLATLRRLPGFRRIGLLGLDESETAELIAARTGVALPEGSSELVGALHRETNGNPFFTREILRNLSETGASLIAELERWASDTVDPARLPESVLDVVRQRVSRLGGDVPRTLAAASIIGRDFDLDLLARVLEEPEEAVLDSLERAQKASVVHEVPGYPDRFTFSHALAQHTMQGELSAARRRRLHRRIAEAIEEMWPGDPGDRIGELASHWRAAVAPVDAERALHYFGMAGQRALDSFAPDEALRWFREALELEEDVPTGDPARRGRLLVQLGVAQKQAGAADYRRTLLDAAELARRADDTDTLVRAALENNRGYHSNTGEPDFDRIAVLETALDAVGEDDSTARALLLATLCAESNFHQPPEHLQALADDALGIARRLGDARTISDVTSRTRVAVYFLDTIHERFDVYAESRRLADEVADPVLCFHAAQALLWAAAARADIHTFDEQLDTMRSISERAGQPTLRWLTRYTEAMRAAIAGDLEASEALAGEALEIGLDSGQGDAETFWGAQVMRVRLMQGRLSELIDLIAAMSEAIPFPVYRSVHAAAATQSGDLDTTRRLLEAEMEQGFDATHEMQWATAMILWAEAAVRLDHREAAEMLYPLLAPFEHLTGFTGLTYDGTIGQSVGQLAVLRGDLDRAEQHFAGSLASATRTSDPYALALTRLGLGRLHRARAERAPDAEGRAVEVRAAQEQVVQARALAGEYGFRCVDRDATEVLDFSR